VGVEFARALSRQHAALAPIQALIGRSRTNA
jgi:hypothetical protein